MPDFLATGPLIGLRRPTAADAGEFVAMIRASRAVHHPWVDFPDTPERFAAYLKTREAVTEDGFLVCDRASGAIAGIVNLNCIVRGFFQSAYLGYGVGQPFAGRGYMTDALRTVTCYAFEELKLHRVEANIQPGNAASIALVKKCGFRLEGFSPRYLQVLGAWRDHERWALLADEE